MTRLVIHFDDQSTQTLEPKPAPLPSSVYRVRKWGDPIMVQQGGFSVRLIGTSNFQAIGLYNKANNQQGGVSNYLRIPQIDVKRLAAMQLEDEFVDKKPGWNRSFNMEQWRVQKMNWLSKERGTIYFHFHRNVAGDWSTLSYIEWGTICLGNNYVTVEDVETMNVAIRDNIRRPRQMARLKGFTPSDWDRPLQELVAAGLVHRCYCAYLDDDSIGDSPKGIVYSPFWSPKHWQFIGPGQKQPDAFYIPMDWLIKE